MIAYNLMSQFRMFILQEKTQKNLSTHLDFSTWQKLRHLFYTRHISQALGVGVGVDLVRWAEKQVRKAFKNRPCLSSDVFRRNEFGRFQLFERKFFEWSGHSLEFFLLTFLFQDKKVSGVWGKAPLLNIWKI